MKISPPPAKSQRRPSGGFSLAELLTVIAIIGIVSTVAAVSWSANRGRMLTANAARTTKALLHQARMSSIHQGVNHFFVFDPSESRIEIFADTGTTVGEFDDSDPRIGGTVLEGAVQLRRPAIGRVMHPLDRSVLSDSWQMPLPDSSARWGSNLRGLRITPTGVIESAEATPQPIGVGALLLSDPQDNLTAVAIRGREGMVRGYQLIGCTGRLRRRVCDWKEL